MTSNCSASSSLHPFITQNLVDTKKYFCPFLDRGFCRDNSKCNFSHDRNTSIIIPNNYCHFYLANRCLYGIDCKFDHLEPDATRYIASGNINSPTLTSTSTTPQHLYDLGYQWSDLNQKCRRHSIGHINMIPYENQFLVCDLCNRYCLQPDDPEQHRTHREECLRELEQEMELSFAIQRSKDKVCGICMDVVVEKSPVTTSRFGILEKCNHIFCLNCIRKWRGTKQFETKTVRACPECRTCSDFVVPSKYWVEESDDKQKLIHDYKANLRSKPCKYFDEGKGECPFAGACFYKHAYPDGRIAKFDRPKPHRRCHRGISLAAANLILWSLLPSTDEEDEDDDEDDDSQHDILSEDEDVDADQS